MSWAPTPTSLRVCLRVPEWRVGVSRILTSRALSLFRGLYQARFSCVWGKTVGGSWFWSGPDPPASARPSRSNSWDPFRPLPCSQPPRSCNKHSFFNILLQKQKQVPYPSVVDPDPGPYVFRPPRSGSVIFVRIRIWIRILLSSSKK